MEIRHLKRITANRRIKKDAVLEKFANLLEANQPTHDTPDNITLACETCQDRGWVAVMVETQSKPMDCPENCEAAQAIQRKRQRVIFDRLMMKFDREAHPMQEQLDTYIPRNPDQERAHNAAILYVTDNIGFVVQDTYKQSLVLVGQVGSGKTHLASAISNELDGQGKTVWYMKFGEMIRRVNACLDDSIKITQLEVIHTLQRVDVLILDDVGRYNVSAATKDLFFDIIDARYDTSRPTVITTNNNQEQMIEKLGEASGDRLRHMAHWVRLDGNVRDKTEVL